MPALHHPHKALFRHYETKWRSTALWRCDFTGTGECYVGAQEG